MKSNIKNICLLFLLFFLTNYSQTKAQLKKEYIEKYIETFDLNIPLDVQVSPNGNNYSYQIEKNKIKIVTENYKQEINGDRIVYLTNKDLYYYEKNQFIKKNITKDINNKNIELGYVKKHLFAKQINYILLENNILYILDKENVTRHENVENIVSHSNLNQEIIIIHKKNESVYINKYPIILKDSIISIIGGVEENLLIGRKNIYKTKNKIISQPITLTKDIKKIIENIIEKQYIPYIYNSDYIYIKKNKDTSTINDYYLSDSYLDLNYFIELSMNIRNTTIAEVISININTGKINSEYKLPTRLSDSYLNAYTTSKSLLNPLIIVNNILESNPERVRPRIHNIIYNKSIYIDSLVSNFSAYEITDDARYIYISTLEKTLFRYDYKKNLITEICKNYPSRKNNIEIRDRSELIDIHEYDPIENKTYLNTSRLPFIIDSNGRIDSVKIRTSSIQNHTNIIIYKIISKDTYILYSMNEENGISELNYIIQGQVTTISQNENYKIPQSLLYNPSRGQNKGFLKIEKNYILWSESNLKNGTIIYVYDKNKKKKKELKFDFNKKYDSLDYKYFSYYTGSDLIKGGIKFPKNYKKDEKYPVILSIYLNKLHSLHFPAYSNNIYYEIENKASNALMNELNLLHQGYIICYIDIPFSNGIYSSHSYYTNEIIKNVLSKIPNIDINNIGLFGHSRTAGQALGTLTKDTIIKCAIISSGVLSELLDVSQFSDYNISSKNKINRESRFTRKLSYSINSSYNFFEDLKNNYSFISKNDPFLNLEKIKSSILFILNDNDASISSNNGYLTYIKSKLLEKNTYLLNFHNESHSIVNEKNKELAYEILIDYLNFFLKDGHDKTEKWNY